MRSLLIYADPGKPPVLADTPESLEFLQEFVGGYIEALQPPGMTDRITGYINENGKFDPDHLMVNPLATLIYQPVIQRGDFIVGNCIIKGFDLSTGDHEDLADDYADRITTHMPALARALPAEMSDMTFPVTIRRVES